MHRLQKLLTACACGLTLLVGAPPPAEAQQNLVVRPMRVEADISANRTSRVILTIRNRNETRSEPLTIEVLDLTQSRDGRILMVDEERRAQMTPQQLVASSRSWVSVPAERVEIPPGETLELPVLITPPPSARGDFISAIRILTDEPEMPSVESDGPTAVFGVRFGFLVPIVTSIAGRPVFQNVSLSDVAIEFDDGRDAAGNDVAEPTTRAFLEIQNEGQTYSKLQGEIIVEARVGSNWRTVTRTSFSDRRILPGHDLRLPFDLERRLPGGEYRLLANVLVDGRRLPRFESEIDFEGDPTIDEAAFDTTLGLDPPLIEMDVVPGATRTNIVAISNPSDQPITVSMSALTPEPLKGVAIGETMGSDLSAESWTQIAPATFTLQPLGRRNVRVMTRVPSEGVDHRHYYADLVLAGEYPDGQSAGQTRSTLMLLQATVPSVPQGVMERLSVAEAEEPSRYFIQARFVNTGNVHLEPVVEARLLDESGRSVASDRLDGEAGLLLPLGIRDFGGEFDLSAVPAGRYVLDARAEIGGETVSRRVPVEIAVEGDVRGLIVLNE